jgi:hypothetical protein
MEGNVLSEQLKQLKEEVIAINNKILKACEGNENLKKLYKGCQIYMSPFSRNPNVLYLGINPGSGFYRANKQIVQKFDPYLPTSPQDFEYEPWKQIKYCFMKLEKERFLDANKFLNDMVKINYYFFATYNYNELKLFFELLPQEFRYEVWKKSGQWIKTIISEVSPKYIICGGFTAEKLLNDLYGKEYTILQNSKNNRVGKLNDMIVFTYQRRFSLMKNRKEFVKFLETYIAKDTLDGGH